MSNREFRRRLAGLGWTFARTTGKNHLVYRCSCGSCPQLVTASTPSDWRSWRNAEARARRCPHAALINA